MQNRDHDGLPFDTEAPMKGSSEAMASTNGSSSVRKTDAIVTNNNCSEQGAKAKDASATSMLNGEAKSEARVNELSNESELVYKYGYSSSDNSTDEPFFRTEVVSTIADVVNETKTTSSNGFNVPKRKKRKTSEADKEARYAILRRCLNPNAIAEVFQVAIDNFDEKDPKRAPTSIFAGLSDQDYSSPSLCEKGDDGLDDLGNISQKQIVAEEKTLCGIAFGNQHS